MCLLGHLRKTWLPAQSPCVMEPPPHWQRRVTGSATTACRHGCGDNAGPPCHLLYDLSLSLWPKEIQTTPADWKNKLPGMSYVSVLVCLFWLNSVQDDVLFSLSISGPSLASEVVGLGSEEECWVNVKPDFLKINVAERSIKGSHRGQRLDWLLVCVKTLTQHTLYPLKLVLFLKKKITPIDWYFVIAFF